MLAIAWTWQLAPVFLAFAVAAVAAGIGWKENK